MTGLIDVHAHFFPPGLPDLGLRSGDGRWPRLEVDAGGDRGRIMCGTSVFRVVRPELWDTAARVASLDREGIATQVVSPVPVTLVGWADAGPAASYLRAQNDAMAEVASGSGGRLLALGALPIQDPDAAAEELRRCRDELGLAGVEIGTVTGGAELDAPGLRPLLAEAAATGYPVFVHPVDGAGAARCSGALESFAIGMLTDTAIAAKALVFGGVLGELPGLRVCLSHGGGAFPWIYPRLRMFATAVAGTHDGAELDRLVRRLTVDSLVFDPAHLPLLVERFGEDGVVFGSDDPFIPWSEVRSVIGPDAPVEAWSRNAGALYRVGG